MTPLLPRLASLAVLTALAGAAHGALIDFEDVVPVDDYGYCRTYGGSLESGGFVFSGDELTSWEPSAPLYIGGNDTGSTAIFSQDAGAFLTMERVDGGTFTLARMDLAHVFPGPGGPDEVVTFVGVKANGAEVTRRYALRDDDGLQSIAFWGFSNLVSVRWNQTPALHQFDNVRVDEAPITPGPAAAVPFALLFLRRRKRA